MGRLAVATVRLKGVEVTFASLYLVVGLGPIGLNLDLLRDTGRTLAELGLP